MAELLIDAGERTRVEFTLGPEAIVRLDRDNDGAPVVFVLDGRAELVLRTALPPSAEDVEVAASLVAVAPAWRDELVRLLPS